MRRPRAWPGGMAALAVVLALAPDGRAQHQHPGPAPASPPGAYAPHRTPAGWKFTLPGGDPARGRAVFEKLECYSCHEVRGQGFPAPPDRPAAGPELAGMAPMHEAEFFAEAIVNPGAVIDRGRGWEGPDGSSKMPSFNDAMTVQELVDLVAFLKSLAPAAPAPAAAPPAAPHRH